MRFIVFVLVFTIARPAFASDAGATFALLIGSNRSVDTNLAPLRYADDDAARYLDLFRLLGARTYLLSRLDENTRRIHPQAAAEAGPPTRAGYEAAVAQLAADVTTAAERGVETTVYFVYAGHGNVENGQGYITLEDLRITGADLARTFARLPATTRVHVIADACASYFLAYARGPGGERRPIDLHLSALAKDPRIGLLLSTSSARESHEWEQFQAGVFSHEVRSGLYGSADADGDGIVTYREIAAFVARANARVPNERYRPDVHARAPDRGDTLLDIRKARGRRVEIDGTRSGHYWLEDARGVRIADAHNAPGQTLSLIRPPPTGRTFLRRASDEMELALPTGSGEDTDVVRVADLEVTEAHVATRGAAHESFSRLFELPFDRAAVEAYEEPHASVSDRREPSATNLRRPVGFGLVGVGAVVIGVGAGLAISTYSLASETGALSHEEATSRNDEIQTRRTAGILSCAGGGLALGAGIAVLLWPQLRGVRASASPQGGLVTYGASF
jgi:hypothetical protein